MQNDEESKRSQRAFVHHINTSYFKLVEFCLLLILFVIISRRVFLNLSIMRIIRRRTDSFLFALFIPLLVMQIISAFPDFPSDF